MLAEVFSPIDVELLKTSPSDSSKIDLIKKLEQNFKYNTLPQNERLIAEEILRFLANDISIRIRQHIATKFCDNLNLPADIALTLATDLEDIVALPILHNSSVLTDLQLVKIIETGNTNRQQAIASRRTISENLCFALISRANPSAVERLISNKNISLSQKSAQAIVAIHIDSQPVMRMMIAHKRIPMGQVYELLTKVSENLQKMLIVSYNIPKNVVNNLVHESRECVIMNLILSHREKADNLSLNQIIENLYAGNELKFPVLVNALSLGEVTFFETALAKIADISIENVRTLIWNEEPSGFHALYSKCNLPALMFDAICKLAAIARDESEHLHRPEKIYHRILHRLSKLASEKTASNVDYLVTIVDHSLRKASLI